MRKNLLPVVLVVMTMLLMACNGCDKKKKEVPPPDITDGYITLEGVEVGDSTVYGECLDAAMNSFTLLTSSGDTVDFQCIGDDEDADVQGGKFVGDRMAVVGIMGDEYNTAQKVINITSLMGRWTSLDKNFEIKDGGVVESSVAAETNPYTSWKIFNGKLILSRDTFDIVSLGPDSLYLENDRGIFAYKRQI